MRLEGSDLTCIRGGREVFSGLGFSLDQGEALVVSGPNGVGKSSLLRTIAGLVRLVKGRLDLRGGNPDLTLAEQAHYLGHQDALKPSLTVAENLRFWVDYLNTGLGTGLGTGLNTGLGTGAAANAEPLAAVGLDGVAELPAAYLSAGQRRRLSLARLLAVRRPVWLLDEPTSALDRPAQDRLTALMAEHLSGGGLIVAAAHGPIGLARAKELRLGGGG